MNLPNKLTLSRVLMIPIFVALLESAYIHGVTPGWRTLLCFLATLVFVAAAITDLVDGALARRWGMVTDFGKLFDPLADKLLVTAALVIFVFHGLFHGWVVVVILSREFIVTGLRGLGERQGRTIAADNWGKAKTISQTVAIIYGLVYLTVDNATALAPWWDGFWNGPWRVHFLSGVLLDVLVTVCLIATVASGVTYLSRNWDLLREPQER
jgi:CDP-diacylglycerol---glycerol-3-phosphate 3-phosphatidyltransferase